jgi:hypothetical protein
MTAVFIGRPQVVWAAADDVNARHGALGPFVTDSRLRRSASINNCALASG